MSKATIFLAAGIAVAITGCAYDQIDKVSYRSDGTEIHTPWGKNEPAPASASSVQITPQDPHAGALYRDNAAASETGPAEQGDRTYYRAPSEAEIDERTAMLMKMSAQMESRAPARVPTALGSTPGKVPAKVSATPRARTVALSPLPGSTGTTSGLVDRVAQDESAHGSTVPSGLYQVVLDFDKSIPVSALKTLLGVEGSAFNSRVVESGDRRVYLGGYDHESQAKEMQSRVEADTGLTPQIVKKRT